MFFCELNLHVIINTHVCKNSRSDMCTSSWNSVGAKKVSVGNILPRAYRRRVSFGIGTLLAVEQSTLENCPREVRHTPSCTVYCWIISVGWSYIRAGYVSNSSYDKKYARHIHSCCKSQVTAMLIAKKKNPPHTEKPPICWRSIIFCDLCTRILLTAVLVTWSGESVHASFMQNYRGNFLRQSALLTSCTSERSARALGNVTIACPCCYAYQVYS